MCEAYTPMICKKCGMSHHYPAKTPNTTQLPDWHCSAKKRPTCGMEARQNGGQFSTLRRYRGKPWTLASCWCSRPRSGCGNAKPRRSGKPAWKPPKRPQGVRTGETLVTYRQGLKTLYGRFGASMDVSKADYMIGVDMARRGFGPDQIGQAIEQAARSCRPARQAMVTIQVPPLVAKSLKINELRRAWSRAKPCISRDSAEFGGESVVFF